MAKQVKKVWMDKKRFPSLKAKKDHAALMNDLRRQREQDDEEKAKARRKKNRESMVEKRKKEKAERAKLAAKEQCDCGKMLSKALARDKET